MNRINRKYIDVHLTRALSMFAVLMLYDAYLSIDNIRRGNIVIGIVALVCSIMTLVSVVILSACRSKKIKSTVPVHAVVSAMCFVYWLTFGIIIFTGGTGGTSIFLLFAVAPVSFFFYNLFYGTIFTGILFLEVTFYMLSPLHLRGYLYPDLYYQRLPIMLFIELIVCWLAQYQTVKAEIKQDDAIREAKLANETQREFLANTSHEIRTPMNSIVGFTELILREEGLSPKARQYCMDILGAGKNLLCVINDILDVSLLEADKLKISEDGFDPQVLVRDIRNSAVSEKGNKNIEVNVKSPNDLPGLILGDQARIFQIVMNLVDNAIKYTSKGGVYIDVRIDRAASPMLIVSVRDTGIGIKEQDLDKIFKSFEQVNTKSDRKAEGTGLGLTISKKIASLMGGVITAESEYGKGSVFTLTIPVRILDNNPSENNPGTRKFTAPTERILLVDDNEVNLMVESGLMEIYGMKITMARSGREALELMDKEKFDLIFMDHMMPEMDGVEVVKRMRDGNSFNKDTTVVALTANAASGAREMFLQNGFQDFLPKPIDVRELDNMLRKHIPLYRICEGEEGGTGTIPDESEEQFTEDEIRMMRESGLIEYEEIQKYLADPEILIMYSDAHEIKSKDIEKYYSEKDWKNYNIQVHALKSSSRMVGAVKLSNLAKQAECASAQKDEVKIDKLQPLLMEQYTQVVELIDKITGK